MSQLNVGLALAATAVLLLGLASGHIKNRLWISEPLIALVIGIIVGPALFDLAVIETPEEQRTGFLLEFARITLAISIMGAALRLPSHWEMTHWRELLVVLGLGMPLMWLAGSAAALVLLGLPVLYCLLLGAVLAPTDPVLADSVVTGGTAERAVPERMRNAITAESGANDGLALLIVLLPVYLLETSAGEALASWVYEVLLLKVLVAIAVGAAFGWVAARAFIWVLRREHSEHPSILTIALALALAVLSVDRLLGTDALLAVFVAGLVFNRTGAAHEEAYHENMQSAVARFFDIPIFIFLGSVLPWSEWASLGWSGIAFAACILLFRRLPAWLLLRPLLTSVRSLRETVFNGWFGPIGIAAVFYAMELRHGHDLQQAEQIWHLVSLVVFASIVLHGITATPLTRAFGRSRGGERVSERGDPDEAGPARPSRGSPAPARARRSREGRR